MVPLHSDDEKIGCIHFEHVSDFVSLPTLFERVFKGRLHSGLIGYLKGPSLYLVSKGSNGITSLLFIFLQDFCCQCHE